MSDTHSDSEVSAILAVLIFSLIKEQKVVRFAGTHLLLAVLQQRLRESNVLDHWEKLEQTKCVLALGKVGKVIKKKER